MSSQLFSSGHRMPRIAEAAVERARLTLVPRPGGDRPPRVPFVALVSLLLVAGVGGLLFFNTSMQTVSFSATELEKHARSLDAERQGLQLELDRLRNPQRVAVAAQDMGMVPASSPAFIRLGDGTVLGTAAPARSDETLQLTPPPAAKPKRLRPRTVVVEQKSPADGGAASPSRDAPAGTKISTDR
ncbi:MAG: hypothetical protein WB441_00480 [Nocardioidaceae bacterium]